MRTQWLEINLYMNHQRHSEAAYNKTSNVIISIILVKNLYKVHKISKGF